MKLKLIYSAVILLACVALMQAQNQDVRRGGGSGSAGISSITNATSSGESVIASGSAPAASLKTLAAGNGITLLSSTTNITVSVNGATNYYRKTLYKIVDESNSAAIIPVDNTNPIITEGAEYKTITYTPQAGSSGHIIKCTFSGYWSATTANSQIQALFVNGATDAAGRNLSFTAQQQLPHYFTVWCLYTNSNDSDITFQMRYGQDSGQFDDTFINKVLSGSMYGGTSYVLAEVEELTQ